MRVWPVTDARFILHLGVVPHPEQVQVLVLLCACTMLRSVRSVKRPERATVHTVYSVSYGLTFIRDHQYGYGRGVLEANYVPCFTV